MGEIAAPIFLSGTTLALVINAASNGNEQPLISARTNVNNTTGVGGTEVFAVDGDGDATFAGDVAIGGTANTYSNQTVLTINGSTYGRLDLESSNTLRSSLFAGSSNTTLAVASGFFTIDVGSEIFRQSHSLVLSKLYCDWLI